MHIFIKLLVFHRAANYTYTYNKSYIKLGKFVQTEGVLC